MKNMNLTQNYISAEKSESELTEYKLYQNFPQSFYKVTRIGFDLPESTYVKLAIYDVFGREVLILINKEFHAGSYEVKWNAYEMKPGVYFYKIRAGEYVESKKMFLINN